MGFVLTPGERGDDEAALVRGLSLKADQVAADVLATAVEHMEALEESLDAFVGGGMAQVNEVHLVAQPSRRRLATSIHSHTHRVRRLARQLAPTE